jgi:hypothetical protein
MARMQSNGNFARKLGLSQFLVELANSLYLFPGTGHERLLICLDHLRAEACGYT